jgi:hypothetical protein
MSTDEKILKALADLQADVTVIKGVQNKQGSQLDTLDLKVEAINAYQKQAHDEIMGHLIESNEINGQDQQQLEKEIERIKKHVGLPPVK